MYLTACLAGGGDGGRSNTAAAFDAAVPVIRFDADDLDRLLGTPIDRKELTDRLPMIGGDLEGVDGDEVAIEFFPNRPDLLSVEGIARAARAFFGLKPGLAAYDVEEGDEEVVIEESVAAVRPFIAFARVDGVELDADRLRELIDLQERLTNGPGRRRKKVAIGIHDAKDVEGAYTYRAVGREEVAFVPLGYTREMTPKQIFDEHDKGRKYRHLLEGHDKVPLIEDKDGHVLSLPPVINGVRTQLSAESRDLLVDVTGPDREAVYGVLNIVVAALAERGGTIRSLRHRQGKKTWVAPDLEPVEHELNVEYASGLLGVDFTQKQVKQALERMGHGATVAKGVAKVKVAPWRLDILHPVDLVEEVAIGYGFEAFEPAMPQRALFGSTRTATRTARRARTILIGHGFTEVVTLTLTGGRDHFESLGAQVHPLVTVANPVTTEQTMLRAWLYPSLLALLRANKHNPLPQNVFEVGTVVPPVAEDSTAHNELRASAVRVASRAGFADAASLADAFLRDAGIQADAKAGAIPGLVEGRTAILHDEEGPVGFYGEVQPQTLEAFELEAPAFVVEVILDRAPTTR